jgi:hypothetical protein
MEFTAKVIGISLIGGSEYKINLRAKDALESVISVHTTEKLPFNIGDDIKISLEEKQKK